jgi:phosphoribosyl-dephospho-CoA transferase
MNRRLHRHMLLRVDPFCWSRVLARSPGVPAGSAAPWLQSWSARGWPVMVRRYLPAESTDVIPAAVSLPPQSRGSGFALRVLEEEIAATVPALALAAAEGAAPTSWLSTIRVLAAAGARCGSEPAVYGSLLWQWLTGLPYLTPRSDLDLCWPVDNEPQARSLTAELSRIAQDSPMRIDGELLLPDGAAVAWREYARCALSADDQELLVKTMHTVSARTCRSLFARAVAA